MAVAAAALRCGACFTALLYLEHWCEAEHGRLMLGDDQPLAAVRPLADVSTGALSDSLRTCAGLQSIH